VNKKQLNKELKEFVVPNVVNKKAQSLPKKIIFLGIMILLIVVGVWFVLAQNTLFGTSGNFDWVSPTPDNYTNTSNSSFISNITINNMGEGIGNVSYCYGEIGNSTCLEFYNNLMLFVNFNNITFENDTIAKDLSINNFTGSILGAGNVSYTAGKFGKALTSTGHNATIVNFTTTTTLPINSSYNYTVSLWIKGNSYNLFNPSVQLIMTKNSEGRYPFEIRQTSLNSTTIGFCEYDGATGICPTKSGVLDNNWHHIVGVHNISHVTLYVDNVYISSSSTSAYYTTRTSNNAPILLFNRVSNDRGFNGSIDQVMIFNTSLSSQQVGLLYGSQFEKHDTANWTLTMNHTTIYGNSTDTSKTLDYQLCVANLTGTTNCSLRVLNTLVPTKNLNINFSNKIGKTRKDIYGVKDYHIWFAEPFPTTHTSYTNNLSNVTWHEQMWLNSGMKAYNQRVYLNYLFDNNTAQYDIRVIDQPMLDAIKEETIFFSENDMDFYISIVNMPTNLQNRSSPMCNASLWFSCPANNWTAYNNDILYLTNYITEGGRYRLAGIVVGNEPYWSDYDGGGDVGWLNAIPTDSIPRALEYVNWFNNTYWTIKNNATFSNILVIGPTSYRPFPNLTSTFLSNQTIYMDGYADHPYDGTNSGTQQVRDISNLITNCSTYGANCSVIMSEEFWVGDTCTSYKAGNQSYWFDVSSMAYANTYIGLTNLLPSNISIAGVWHWTEGGAVSPNYLTNSTLCNTPYYEGIVDQPYNYNASNYQYQTKAPYNTTTNFAHVCPPQSDIYSSPIDTCVHILQCKKGSQYGIILANNCTNVSYDISNLNLSLTNGSVFYPYPNITNYLTHETYNVSNGVLTGSSLIIDGVIGNSIIYLTSGITPTITNMRPIDNNYSTNSTINFSANLTDDIGLTNSTLNIMNTLDNITTTYIVNYVSGEKSIIQTWVIKIIDGIYKWWINIFDDEGKEIISSNYTLTTNITSPRINFESPTPLNNSNTNSIRPIIQANISDTLKSYSFIDFDNTLLGYWSMDNYNNTGIVGNLSNSVVFTFANGLNYSNLSTGVYGKALTFDGVDDTLTNANYLDGEGFSNGFTISFWIYNNWKNNVYVLGKTNACKDANSNNTGWDFKVFSGSFIFETCRGAQYSFNAAESTNFPNSTWVHVVGIQDTTNKRLLFYKNGVLSVNQSYTNSNISTTNTFTIGGISQYFNGSLDELIIFNRTLSQSEITALYNSTQNKFNSTFSNLQDGQYNYTVYAIDEEGNLNSSSQSFYSETTYPNISFVSPTSASTNLSQSNIYLNVSTSDLSNHSVLSNIGLKLWLRFNNETGENNTYVKDYSGYGNNASGFNGTVSNSSGKFDDCIKLNGTSYFKSTNDSSLNITNAITLSAWVKLDNYTNYNRIVAKSKSTNTYPYTMYGLMLGLNSSGTSRLRMELASGGIQHYVHSTSNITLNEWVLLTGTYNGTSAKLYINGVLDNSTLFKYFSNGTNLEVSTLTNSLIDTNNIPVTIGASYYNADYLNGSIDDVLIYNRALSLNEIQAYYNATRLDHNITNLADGNYNVTVYAQDSSGNINSTSRWITLDTTPPIITITNPTTADENANPVNLIASTNEVSTCAYSLDSQANISMGTNTGFLVPITLSNGVHTIKVFCNDSLINQNTTGASISFNVYLGGGVTGGGGTDTDPIVNVTNTTIINNTTVIGNESEKFDGKIDLGEIKIGEFTIGTWALIGIIVGILFLILLAFIIDAIRKK
jgi:hypothetical protein